ncbi:MAG: hypothetical protein DRG25_06730 [Deltaproteobacteria bacterium]|nr:MAG: hypothetical protein DRG25_06730 [Deltaproteobacteria bacterium]
MPNHRYRKIRILHLIPTLQIGGAELDMVRKALILSTYDDFEIFILPFQGLGPLNELINSKARIKVIPPFKRGNSGMLATGLRLNKLVNKLCPNIIHLHMFRSELVGVLLNLSDDKPVIVYTIQHITADEPFWKRIFIRLTAKYKDKFIASSQAVKQSLVECAKLEEEKIEVIYNSVDFSKFDHLKYSPPDNDEPVIGTITRLHPDKGVQYLIKAFSKVTEKFPQAQCWIIGDGKEKVNLRALAKRLGVEKQIKFWGWIKEPHHLLARMNLFVFPSVTEALGIALIEALGIGVPAVASNVGGIPEILENKTDWLVPPRQAYLLADKILEILFNYSQARKEASLFIPLVREKFDVKRLAVKQAELYRLLVG